MRVPFGRRETLLASAEEAAATAAAAAAAADEAEVEGAEWKSSSSGAAAAVAASPHFVVHNVSMPSAHSPARSVAPAPDVSKGGSETAQCEVNRNGEGGCAPLPMALVEEDTPSLLLPEETIDDIDEIDEAPLVAEIKFEKSSALLLHTSERYLSAICGNAWIEKEKEGTGVSASRLTVPDYISYANPQLTI